MTRDYAKRVEHLRTHLQGAEVSTLIRIHGELLRIAPGIRVRARWGDRTSYAVKLREDDAVEITSECEYPIVWHLHGRYRIQFGASVLDGMHAHIVRWVHQDQQWTEWDTGGSSELLWDWLRKHQPAAMLLLEIDMQLLHLQEAANA